MPDDRLAVAISRSDIIAEVNVLDVELYQDAKEPYDEQVRQQGASFAQQVRDF